MLPPKLKHNRLLSECIGQLQQEQWPKHRLVIWWCCRGRGMLHSCKVPVNRTRHFLQFCSLGDAHRLLLFLTTLLLPDSSLLNTDYTPSTHQLDKGLHFNNRERWLLEQSTPAWRLAAWRLNCPGALWKAEMKNLSLDSWTVATMQSSGHTSTTPLLVSSEHNKALNLWQFQDSHIGYIKIYFQLIPARQ